MTSAGLALRRAPCASAGAVPKPTGMRAIETAKEARLKYARKMAGRREENLAKLRAKL